MKQTARSLLFPTFVVGLLLVAIGFEGSLIARLNGTALDAIATWLPYVLRSALWFAGAHLTNDVIGIVLWDPIHRKVPVPRLLRDVTAVLIYLLAITGIVGTVFHKEIGPFWAASGAGAIVIGLALRNVILDIFIGLAVNFDRPFEIGDFIQLQSGSSGGPNGRVLELNWRTTRLVTGEGNLIIIPNGKLGDMVVTNFSKPEPVSEFGVSVFLAFEVPTDRALRVLSAAVMSISGTTGILENPGPKVRIRGFGAQGVEYRIKYFLDPRLAGPGKARDALWKALIDQLHRAGLEPASPKQDVYEAPMPQRHLDMRSSEDRAQLLQRVELFQELTHAECEQLGERMRERLFRAGDAVITRGDAGDSMFVLSEGLLNVMIALAPGQPETRVARLMGGQCFGEMSALTGEPRSATIVAATDALVFEITKGDLSALIETRASVAESLAHTMAARKLRNSTAAADAGSVTAVAEEKSLTAQLVGKMLAFFGMKGRGGMTAAELEENSALNPFA